MRLKNLHTNLVKAKPKTDSEREKAYRDKLKKKGWKQLRIWLPERLHGQVSRLCKQELAKL